MIVGNSRKLFFRAAVFTRRLEKKTQSIRSMFTLRSAAHGPRVRGKISIKLTPLVMNHNSLRALSNDLTFRIAVFATSPFSFRCLEVVNIRQNLRTNQTELCKLSH